jgi:hypothetical protein
LALLRSVTYYCFSHLSLKRFRVFVRHFSEGNDKTNDRVIYRELGKPGEKYSKITS